MAAVHLGSALDLDYGCRRAFFTSNFEVLGKILT